MPQYSEFQPKPYRPQMSAYWFFDRWPYLRFVLRELSSFFVAWFAVVIMLQIRALSAGPTAYAHFQTLMASPCMIITNAVTLVFLLFHAITWFALVPRVMVKQMTNLTISEITAAAPNVAVLLGASAIIALFILRIL
jgi:fumarate reductase subunit C